MKNQVTTTTAILVFVAIVGFAVVTFCLHFFIEMMFDVSFFQSILIVGGITGPMVPAVWDKISATSKADT